MRRRRSSRTLAAALLALFLAPPLFARDHAHRASLGAFGHLIRFLDEVVRFVTEAGGAGPEDTPDPSDPANTAGTETNNRSEGEGESGPELDPNG